MWHVPLVRNLQPQFQVSELLCAALGDVYAALEADFGELRLREAVDVLHVEPRVLLPQLAVVHVELASDEGLGHDVDQGSIDWDLLLEEPKYIVNRVQTRDRRDAHEVCHVHESLGSEHAELAIPGEQATVL